MVVKRRTIRRRKADPPPLTAEEVRAMIDEDARKHLGMSGDEFIQRWRRKELPYSPVAFDLGILVSALDAYDASSQVGRALECRSRVLISFSGL